MAQQTDEDEHQHQHQHQHQQPAHQQHQVMKRKRICLFGTSANPPTGNQGHGGIVRALSNLAAASTGGEMDSPTALCFDEIRVVPVYSHPFSSKRNQLAPFEHRFNMCQLAFADIPNVTISQAEYEIYHDKLAASTAATANDNHNNHNNHNIRVGTADLLEYYLANDNNNHGTPSDYTLCLGADTFLDLMSGKWRRTEEILDSIQGRFIVLYRAEHEQEPDDNNEDSDNNDDDAGDNDNNDTDNNPQPRENTPQHQQLQAAIGQLEERYGKECAQLLHVPALGAVSSTLVRSLSSSLSLKDYSRHSSASNTTLSHTSSTSATNHATTPNNKQQDDGKEEEEDFETHSQPEPEPSETIISPEQQRAIEERIKRMVDPNVLEYMIHHELYGFGIAS